MNYTPITIKTALTGQYDETISVLYLQIKNPAPEWQPG
ncbi:hypothetical protein BH09BAC6_BH09BAC6_18810 [soil metagenome]|jgi:hypothetical protein